MSKLEIYFDFVEIGSDIEIGMAIVEDDEVVGSFLKEYEDAKRLTNGNNFHFTLTAWRDAVRYLIKYVVQEGLEDELEKVTFCNQNGAIFKWARSGECSETYVKVLAQIMDATSTLSDVVPGLTYAFKKIEGKNNRVKKLLKKRKSLKGAQEEEFSFAPIVPKISKGSTQASNRVPKLTESALGMDNVVDMSTYSYERKLKEG